MKNSDTSIEMEKIQNSILGKLKPEDKIKITFNLIRFQCNLIVEGIKYFHPEYNEHQIKMELKRILLGEDLFNRVYFSRKEE